MTSSHDLVGGERIPVNKGIAGHVAGSGIAVNVAGSTAIHQPCYFGVAVSVVVVLLWCCCAALGALCPGIKPLRQRPATPTASCALYRSPLTGVYPSGTGGHVFGLCPSRPGVLCVHPRIDRRVRRRTVRPQSGPEDGLCDAVTHRRPHSRSQRASGRRHPGGAWSRLYIGWRWE